MIDKKIKATALIKDLVAKFVQQEANTNPLITITNADVSPDMRRAIIFFTTIPDGKEADALIFLKRSASAMRNYMKSHARLRNIPHLEFMIDAGERHRQHMDELVREIEKNKPTT
jgi:ribosome-binding factor A